MDADDALRRDDPAEWLDAGAAADLRVGEPASVVAGGRRLLLVRTGDAADAVVAADDACPHRGDPLSTGLVRGPAVLCRSHGFAFDLASGACVAGDRALRLPLHEARVRDGRVRVRLRR